MINIGKSTQIPQFLLEYGYARKNGPNPARIGVYYFVFVLKKNNNNQITEPIRIAAVSLAKRVSMELNMELGQDIAYQVRYESSNYTEETKIKV